MLGPSGSLEARHATVAPDERSPSVGVVERGEGARRNDTPVVSIRFPLDGREAMEATRLTLSGTGLEPEDGSLSGNSLAWYSDIGRGLGIGTTLTVVRLRRGGPHAHLAADG